MFSDEEIKLYPILAFFHYKHLTGDRQAISRACGEQAAKMIKDLKPSAEVSAGLRKLLEAKDCFVRAIL